MGGRGERNKGEKTGKGKRDNRRKEPEMDDAKQRKCNTR